MAFYRITYKGAKGDIYDDYLLEERNKDEAVYTAKHKVDGSYGPTDLVFVSLKRISLQEARAMVAGNCVCWANDPRLDE